MLNIIISFLTFVLILISLFMVLVILMQRGSSGGGMGSAFGGGATKWSALGFFVIALSLYLLYMEREQGSTDQGETDLPDIPVEMSEEAAPAEELPGETTPPEGEGEATAEEGSPETRPDPEPQE